MHLNVFLLILSSAACFYVKVRTEGFPPSDAAVHAVSHVEVMRSVSWLYSEELLLISKREFLAGWMIPCRERISSSQNMHGIVLNDVFLQGMSAVTLESRRNARRTLAGQSSSFFEAMTHVETPKSTGGGGVQFYAVFGEREGSTAV